MRYVVDGRDCDGETCAMIDDTRYRYQIQYQ